MWTESEEGRDSAQREYEGGQSPPPPGLRTIAELASQLGLDAGECIAWGPDRAKINFSRVMERRASQSTGKLILVTAMSPTPAGEGKTTSSIALADALQALGKRSLLCLREPSLGPVFGRKGGATGGGRAQLHPAEDINLHFTGDFHALTAANNLLAAAIDNHIYHGNTLGIDPQRVCWRRCLDVNDRALRQVQLLAPSGHPEVERGESFQITVASELMAILCLSRSYRELKERIGRIICAYDRQGRPIRAEELAVHEAVAALLRDALMPNLVQTLEGCPAFVHGGPFANIAHGCSSLLATQLGLKLADYVVTEAGFGADLGAEKFLDICCREASIWPSAVLLVASVRALKYHGGQALDQLQTCDLESLRRGYANLQRHARNLQTIFGLHPLVLINSFAQDHPEEWDCLSALLAADGLAQARSEAWAKGSEGMLDAAKSLLNIMDEAPSQAQYAYELEQSLSSKIEQLALRLYGARELRFSPSAQEQLRELERSEARRRPICMAKTPYSFSADPRRLGAARDFCLEVSALSYAAGAGFVIVYCGEIMTLPALPAQPAALRVKLSDSGVISGIY